MAMECCRLFFGSNIMNHVDFLKHITNLEKDDHVLAIEMLDHFNQKASERRGIDPFYDNHHDFARNEVRICDVYLQFRELKSHQANIYQGLFLNPEGIKHALSALVCFVIQIFILIALVVHSVNDGDITDDPMIYGIIGATSIFFCSACYGEASSSWTFWKQTASMDPSKRKILYLDLIINVWIAALIPAINVFLLLKSDSLIDTVLNSTAIFFVVELDDILAPKWDNVRWMDELACNFHDYIMAPNEYDIDVVRMDSSTASPFDYSNCYVYGKCESGSVSFFCIDKDFSVRTIQYKVTGTDALLLIERLEQFYCCQRFYDIHD